VDLAMTDAPFPETHRLTLERALDVGSSAWEPFELSSAIRAALAEIDRLEAILEIARHSLARRINALPRRLENISGQTFSYVKTDDVLAIIDPEAR
jgi:hypothetical protein